jgi:hypothetical protein
VTSFFFLTRLVSNEFILKNIKYNCYKKNSKAERLLISLEIF